MPVTGVLVGLVLAMGIGLAEPAGSTPYDPSSPWNTPIGPNPVVDTRSAAYIGAVADNGMPLTSDRDQYAIPVYAVEEDTPKATVKLTGFFSSYDRGDRSRVGGGANPVVSNVPIPKGARGGQGSDGQIVFLDARRGIEWGFWQFRRSPDGTYAATNGYRYHTTAGYHGRFADPASKSDGSGSEETDLPEGARLQLDPSLGERDFDTWKLSPAARVIARALQTYGMYVIDHSGSSKIYLEDQRTAQWESDIDRDVVSAIPWSAFRVIAPPNQTVVVPQQAQPGSSRAPIFGALLAVSVAGLTTVWYRRRVRARHAERPDAEAAISSNAEGV
jgi:hypothetical protein